MHQGNSSWKGIKRPWKYIPDLFLTDPPRNDSNDSFPKFSLQGKASFDSFPDLLERVM